MKFTCDYNKQVPKLFDKNIEWRKFIYTKARLDDAFAEQMWIMCSRDILFYINTFVFTFNPRKSLSKIPFITYPYQDEALLEMLRCVEDGEDAIIAKTRDMGASWLILMLFEWYWKFHHGKTFLIGSRKEDLVDKSGDPDSLFWKLDYIQLNQPDWLVPDYTRNMLHFHNDENGSTIDGESMNKDFARGGRRTAILNDEFASVENGHDILAATADSTNCRLFNSTPKGVANAFYDQWQKEDIVKIRMHWTQHPEKARGLYTDSETSKPRSPWYDRECKRRTPMEVAQELDIDFFGSDHQFFDSELIENYKKQHCRPACLIGELDFDHVTGRDPKFHEVEGGPMSLWFDLELPKYRPPKDRHYVIGADIATGTGASNSVLSIVDKRSGERVAEYVHCRISPVKFAKVAYAMCNFFSGASEFNDETGAFIIWESNGPGRSFGDALIELGYRNIFYSENERNITKEKTQIPGWFSNAEYKMNLLEQYREALVENRFINRSWHAIDECNAYVYGPNSTVANARSISTNDPSGARSNHADRVIADALSCRAAKNTNQVVGGAEQKVIVGSVAYRKQEYDKRRVANQYW